MPRHAGSPAEIKEAKTTKTKTTKKLPLSHE